MINDCVAVLEIGSSKICAIIGKKEVNDTFLICSSYSMDYDGYSDGKFFGEEDNYSSLALAIEKCLSNVIENGRLDIIKLYVSVPSAFLSLQNKKFKISLTKKKKVSSSDVEDLYNMGKNCINVENYKVINNSAIYFLLDDNRKIYNPVGQISSTLSGYISYFLMNNYFDQVVGRIVRNCKINEISYVAEPLAEAQYILSQDVRESVSLLVDCGYMSTTLSLVSGNGVLDMKTIEFGGAFVELYLLEDLKLDSEKYYDVIKRLKRDVNLGFVDNENLTPYVVSEADEKYYFKMNSVNNSVESSLNILVESIKNFILRTAIKLSANLDMFITGGGISYIKGVEEYISSRFSIHTNVEVVAPKDLNNNKPIKSAEISLLNYSLNEEEKEIKNTGILGFIKKVLNK